MAWLGVLEIACGTCSKDKGHGKDQEQQHTVAWLGLISAPLQGAGVAEGCEGRGLARIAVGRRVRRTRAMARSVVMRR